MFTRTHKIHTPHVLAHKHTCVYRIEKDAHKKTLNNTPTHKNTLTHLQELVQEEGEPVCQHFLCYRLRPKRGGRGWDRAKKKLMSDKHYFKLQETM